MPDIPPEVAQTIRDYLNRLVDFETGTSHACPTCGQDVDSAELHQHVERDSYSLYVFPCGCRLGTWGGAPKWIPDVEIIPFDPQTGA